MVLEKKASSARFKFFIQQTIWAPGELKKEIEVRPSFPPSLPPSLPPQDKVWYPAQVRRE